MAAFFATRQYPYYTHFSGTEDVPIGVIYRFRRWEDPESQKELEEALFNIGIELQPPARVGWFRRRMSIRHLITKGHNDKLDRLRKYFERYGTKQAGLATRSVIVSYEAVEKLYSSQLEKMGVALQTQPLTDSRMHRQRGGLYYPSVSHLCWVPVDVQFLPAKRPGDFIVRPSLVLQQQLLGVLNGNYARHIEAFFFCHSDEEVTGFTPGYLWPDEGTDRLLAVIATILRVKCAEYLNDKNIDVFDPQLGIIDRGYATIP